MTVNLLKFPKGGFTVSNKNKNHNNKDFPKKQLKPHNNKPVEVVQPPQVSNGINPGDFQVSILSKEIARLHVELSKSQTILALAQTEIAQLRAQLEQQKPKE